MLSRVKKRRQARSLSERGQRTQHSFHFPTRSGGVGPEIFPRGSSTGIQDAKMGRGYTLNADGVFLSAPERKSFISLADKCIYGAIPAQTVEATTHLKMNQVGAWLEAPVIRMNAVRDGEGGGVSHAGLDESGIILKAPEIVIDVPPANGGCCICSPLVVLGRPNDPQTITYMNGKVSMGDLPVEDPEVSGELWRDGGVLMVSLGAPP